MTQPISNISAATLAAIIRKTAATLPDRPGDQGMSAETVRQRFYKAITDETNSVLAELTRVINEANEELQALIDVEFGNTDLDDESTEIEYTLAINEDKSYSQETITLVDITIPATIEHGFFGGVNYKSGSSPVAVSFTNLSTLPLKLIRFGYPTENYTPPANVTVGLSFYCDGINIICRIIEVA